MNQLLLRVCSALFIVSGLNTIAGLLLRLLAAGMSDESLMAGYIGSIVMGVLGIAAGIASLVKKTPIFLMILSVLSIAMRLFGAVIIPYTYSSMGLETGVILNAFVDNFVDPSLVLCITTFFIGLKKTVVEESGLNLGLLRFCAVIFIVDGANDLFKILLSYFMKTASGFVQPLSWFSIALVVVSIAVGIFAIAKRNSLVLKVYALVAFVQILWNNFAYVREHMFGGFYIGNAIVGLVFNMFFVVGVATFFVNVEETKFYFQKLKKLFFRRKTLT